MFEELTLKLASILEESLKNNVFSACSLGYFRLGKESRHSAYLCYGKSEHGERAIPVDLNSVYDLASLTKPLVTALCLLALMEEGKVQLGDRVGTFFSGSVGEVGSATLEQLLNHSSGLAAHRPFYMDIAHLPAGKRQERVIGMILND